MRLIAFYLPQYHAIPENDKWWGKGFTEWTNVKRAVPLFDGHEQPRVPENGNYYCLLDADNATLRRQSDLANVSGVYGFAFYHYWYCGKKLLEKPVENFLADKSIDTNFCLCWANHDWTNGWVSQESKILLKQTYGTEQDWLEHFNYMLPYFRDGRYIYENGKPLLIIYKPELCDCLDEMLIFLNAQARRAGLPGLQFAFMSEHRVSPDVEAELDQRILRILFQPTTAISRLTRKRGVIGLLSRVKQSLASNRFVKVPGWLLGIRGAGVKRVDYDSVWREILSIPGEEGTIPGAFSGWDNTPRRAKRGSVVTGDSPDKFEHYLGQLIEKANREYKTDMIFINAWNEWGEGCYLEPDERFHEGYLRAIRNCLAREN